MTRGLEFPSSGGVRGGPINIMPITYKVAGCRNPKFPDAKYFKGLASVPPMWHEANENEDEDENYAAELQPLAVSS